MRIVGVIDLRRGQAVHARGGDRERYQPVARAAGIAIDGDPVRLAQMYAAGGVRELYVADLDAIAGGPSQSAETAHLAESGLPIMLDAGISSARAAAREDLSADRVVVGLETLSSWIALQEIVERIGGTRTVFSLDLRNGAPLGRLMPPDAPAQEIAARAVAAGAGTVLVIDVARVGMAAGPGVERLRAIRAAIPDVPLLAGGGVRGDEDLAMLEACGCDGALVATALQEGRIANVRSGKFDV